MHVVVAHPRREIRDRMGAALTGVGIDVVDRGDDDGDAALLAAIRRYHPDVAVLAEPSLIREIVGDPELLSTSVILLGDGDVRAVLDALDHGAHDVLSDPPGDAELIARVRAAARASSLREQLLARETRLEQLVFNDELTGLWNRRFLQRRMAAELHAAHRHGHGLSVAMVDVDHFKAVNDHHGHGVGDAVLVAVAERLAAAVRTDDIIGRWGGEEFLAILPRIDTAGAHTAAERIRRCVAEAPVGRERIPITVSVGCATLAAERSADALLGRADDALYAAKRGGRNAVVVAGHR
jgi:two-component system, cell cycle response regulator